MRNKTKYDSVKYMNYFYLVGRNGFRLFGRWGARIPTQWLICSALAFLAATSRPCDLSGCRMVRVHSCAVKVCTVCKGTDLRFIID